MSQDFLSYIRISMDYFSNEKFSEFRGIDNIKEIIVENIKLLKSHNIKVGVGMTVMKDNMDDIQPLMKLSDQLGVDFFRSVPVLPIGRAKDMEISIEFYSDVLQKFFDAAQEVQSHYFTTMILPDNLGDLKDSVIVECPGGGKVLAIDAYGYVKRCPISSISTKFSIREKSLKELYESVAEDVFIQKQLAVENGCKNCNDNKLCKGGCYVERESRNQNIDCVNPGCVKDIWTSAFNKLAPTAKLRRLVNNIMCIYNTQSMYRIPMCYRLSPLWWLPLDGKVKESK